MQNHLWFDGTAYELRDGEGGSFIVGVWPKDTSADRLCQAELLLNRLASTPDLPTYRTLPVRDTGSNATILNFVSLLKRQRRNGTRGVPDQLMVSKDRQNLTRECIDVGIGIHFKVLHAISTPKDS